MCKNLPCNSLGLASVLFKPYSRHSGARPTEPALSEDRAVSQPTLTDFSTRLEDGPDLSGCSIDCVERNRTMLYATEHSDPKYRPLEQYCYATWGRINRDHFGGILLPPHIGFGPIASGRPCVFSSTTTNGARCDFLLNEGIAFGTNRDWVISPFPSIGVARVLEDFILRLTVQQAVFETHQTTEDGSRGNGPLFCEFANRIGTILEMSQVVPRSRGEIRAASRTALHWPHGTRPEGYYGEDITEALDRHLRGTRMPRPKPTPGIGIAEYELFLLDSERYDRLRKVILQRIHPIENARLRNRGLYRAIEAGTSALFGNPLPEDARRLDAAWVSWNNFCVPRIATGIQEQRTFWAMVILADALEDAGCDNPHLLQHCRANIPHSYTCWALAAIVDQARALAGEAF